MQKLILVLVFMLCITQSYSQHKLMLRPSLGNGKAFTTNQEFKTNATYLKILFDKYQGVGRFPGLGNRILQNPQIGFMLEYSINKNNVIGFGWVKGRTDADFRISFDGGNYWSGSGVGSNINKTGLEYTRNFFLKDYTKLIHSKLNRLFFSALVGASIVNHRFNNYECCHTTFVKKDNAGNTIDSSTSKSEFLNYHGLIVTSSIRVGVLNKKLIEKLSITFSYDYGFHPLRRYSDYTYYNYLSEFYTVSMVTRGSQFKIYLSMPLTLYDFDKQRLKREAKRK
jgi:hypothetical protein